MDLLSALKSYRAQQVKNGLAVWSSLVQLRYFFRWYQALRPGADTVAAGVPWVTFGSIDELSRLVRPGFRIFEYGSGGSTVFFSRRAGQVYSVEHDPEWFAKVGSFLKRENLSCTTWLKEPSPNRSSPNSTEISHSFASTAKEFAGLSFEDYAKSIDIFADEYFDLILLDGRARPGCYAVSLRKLKPGGTIVLDNAEREEYFVIERDAMEKGFHVKEFFGPGPYNEYFWRTIHLTRPAA
jgi:hypothetical protein